MKTTFAHACALHLLRHYPHAWRERYADEAAAVLEERPATFRTLFDLCLGMLDAYLHTELFTERKFVMLQRLRNSQITIFGSFVFFAIFWAFYLLIEAYSYRFGVPSWDYASPPPNFAFVFPIVRIAGLCAILMTLLGGCAFIRVALKQAFARNKQNIRPLIWTLLGILMIAFPVGLITLPTISGFFGRFTFLLFTLCIAGFLLFTVIGNLLRLRQGIRNAKLSLHFMYPTLIPCLMVIAISFIIYCSVFLFSPVSFSHSTSLAFFVLMIMAIAGVIASGVIYLVRRIRQITFSPRFLRLTFIPAAMTALGMSVTLCLALFQVLAIDLHVNEHGLELLRVPLLNIIVGGIAFPTVLACISLWRGFKARQELMVLV